MELTTQIILSISLIIASGAAIVSFFEREYKAAKKLLFLFLILAFILFLITQYEFQLKNEILIAFNASSLFLAILLLIPSKGKKHKPNGIPADKIDERTIMFSRRDLVPGSETYHKYYQLYPEHKKSDEEFRENPGLLNDDAALFDPFMFNSSKAAFETVEKLAGFVDGVVADKKQTADRKKITNYISEWTKHLGSHTVGFTLLNENHVYKIGGRKRNYGEQINLNHKYAIAFTTEMDFDMVKAAPKAPITMESAKQYLTTATIACQLAAFIRNLGYSARAHVDGNYEVICPLVAKDAGLGEIGRMGLLMTPKLGPRVRIGIVTTELELNTNKPTSDNSIIDFCTICKKCADVCPSKAISFDERREIKGALRWQINQEACYNYWCVTGTDCGRCMSVCPYSHPNNILHNMVRAGIKNSSVFRKFALKMDDLLYGRKPMPAKLQKWMEN